MDEKYKKELLQNYKELYKDELKNVDSIDDVFILLIKLMQSFAEYNNLKGKEKKLMVINIITDLLENSKLMKNSPEGIKFMLKGVLPTVIDFLFNAINGKWKMEYKKIQNNKFFSCCC